MKRYFQTISKNKPGELANIIQTSELSSLHNIAPENNVINNRNTPTATNDLDNSDDSDPTVETPQRKQYKQNYKPEWEVSFPWLKKVNDLAFCTICFKVLANNKTHLRRHQTSSKSHATNLQIKNVTATIEQSFQSVDNSTSHRKKATEFGCVMYCVQYDLPFLQMDSLPKLLQTTCHDSQLAKDLKCGRTKCTAMINQVIGPFSKQKISRKLQNTNFSLMIDETTDLSTTKCLVMVARFFDTHKNNVIDCFLGLIELSASTAQQIFNEIEYNFKNSNIPMENVISLAVDNAAVMAGHLNGVVSKFYKINKHLFFLRCTCHSLHLCASAACKKLPNSIEKNVKNIFNHFAHSPKRIGSFREFQNYFDVENHKILRLSTTRWLSFESVVNRLLEQWNPLKHYFRLYDFEELHSSNAAEIYEFLTDPLNKCYLLFMSYVLKLVNEINTNFQSELTQIHVLYSQMHTLYIEILKNFIKPEYLKLDTNTKDPEFHLTPTAMYFGIKFENFLISEGLEEPKVKALKLTLISFYIEIAAQIKQRFDFNDEKLKLLKYLNINEIVTGSLPSIMPLINNFPFHDCDLETLNNQFRRLIGNFEIAAKFSGDVTKFWIELKLYKDVVEEPIFTEISKYMLILCSLPHSTASAERKFSKLNLIKTNLRTNLNTTTVENLMFAKELLKPDKACWEPGDTPELLKFSDKFKYIDGKYQLK